MQVNKNPTKFFIDKALDIADQRARSGEAITRTDMIGQTSTVDKDLLEAGYRISLMRKCRRLKVPFRLSYWMFEHPMKVTDAQIALMEQFILEKESGHGL